MLFRRELFAGQTKATFTMLVVNDCFVELLFVEVGPKHWSETEFGIGSLPQEEVADAALSTGSDQEVGCRDAVRVEATLNGSRVDILRIEFALLNLKGNLLDSMGNLFVTGVAERQYESEAVVGGCLSNTFCKKGLRLLWELTEVAYGLQTDMVYIEGRQLGNQILYQQIHQAVNLCLRTIPVFGGEGVEGEVFDTQFGGSLSNETHRLYSLSMSENTFFTTEFCPTSVAVHDDGDVIRQSCEVYLLLE